MWLTCCGCACVFSLFSLNPVSILSFILCKYCWLDLNHEAQLSENHFKRAEVALMQHEYKPDKWGEVGWDGYHYTSLSASGFTDKQAVQEALSLVVLCRALPPVKRKPSLSHTVLNREVLCGHTHLCQVIAQCQTFELSLCWRPVAFCLHVWSAAVV